MSELQPIDSDAVAQPGEPLGLTQPILPDAPLGQTIVRRRFIVPLGVRTLTVLDPSIFMRSASALDLESFQEPAFFPESSYRSCDSLNDTSNHIAPSQQVNRSPAQFSTNSLIENVADEFGSKEAISSNKLLQRLTIAQSNPNSAFEPLPVAEPFQHSAAINQTTNLSVPISEAIATNQNDKDVPPEPESNALANETSIASEYSLSAKLSSEQSLSTDSLIDQSRKPTPDLYAQRSIVSERSISAEASSSQIDRKQSLSIEPIPVPSSSVADSVSSYAPISDLESLQADSAQSLSTDKSEISILAQRSPKLEQTQSTIDHASHFSPSSFTSNIQSDNQRIESTIEYVTKPLNLTLTRADGSPEQSIPIQRKLDLPFDRTSEHELNTKSVVSSTSLDAITSNECSEQSASIQRELDQPLPTPQNQPNSEIAVSATLSDAIGSDESSEQTISIQGKLDQPLDHIPHRLNTETITSTTSLETTILPKIDQMLALPNIVNSPVDNTNSELATKFDRTQQASPTNATAEPHSARAHLETKTVDQAIRLVQRSPASSLDAESTSTSDVQATQQSVTKSGSGISEAPITAPEAISANSGVVLNQTALSAQPEKQSSSMVASTPQPVETTIAAVSSQLESSSEPIQLAVESQTRPSNSAEAFEIAQSKSELPATKEVVTTPLLVSVDPLSTINSSHHLDRAIDNSTPTEIEQSSTLFSQISANSVASNNTLISEKENSLVQPDSVTATPHILESAEPLNTERLIPASLPQPPSNLFTEATKPALIAQPALEHTCVEQFSVSEATIQASSTNISNPEAANEAIHPATEFFNIQASQTPPDQILLKQREPVISKHEVTVQKEAASKNLNSPIDLEDALQPIASPSTELSMGASAIVSEPVLINENTSSKLVQPALNEVVSESNLESSSSQGNELTVSSRVQASTSFLHPAESSSTQASKINYSLDPTSASSTVNQQSAIAEPLLQLKRDRSRTSDQNFDGAELNTQSNSKTSIANNTTNQVISSVVESLVDAVSATSEILSSNNLSSQVNHTDHSPISRASAVINTELSDQAQLIDQLPTPLIQLRSVNETSAAKLFSENQKLELEFDSVNLLSARQTSQLTKEGVHLENFDTKDSDSISTMYSPGASEALQSQEANPEIKLKSVEIEHDKISTDLIPTPKLKDAPELQRLETIDSIEPQIQLIQNAEFSQPEINPVKIEQKQLKSDLLLTSSTVLDHSSESLEDATELKKSLPQVLQPLGILQPLAQLQNASSSRLPTVAQTRPGSTWTSVSTSLSKPPLSKPQVQRSQANLDSTVIQAASEPVRLSRDDSFHSEIDQPLEALAQAIYRQLKQRLRIEQERHGRNYSGRLL